MLGSDGLDARWESAFEDIVGGIEEEVMEAENNETCQICDRPASGIIRGRALCEEHLTQEIEQIATDATNELAENGYCED